VSYDYPVHFDSDVFKPANLLLREVLDRKGGSKPHRAMVYIDSGVTASRPEYIRQIETYFSTHAGIELAAEPEVVAGGERAKNGWTDVQRIMGDLAKLHMCRQSFVVAIGGGSVLDMVGFATALVHRGLRLVRIPSTVLAQNDSGVGVKNGMNERRTKNFVGAFAPPFAVIDDFALLSSLEDRDWRGGIAEAFKVAIIKDANFFDFLCKNAAKLRARDQDTMEELIRRCARLHLEHIRGSGDPFEFGTSRPLDFGHWAAHKLEVMSGFSMGHGQAVAIGIALDSFYAMASGLLRENEFDRIVKGLLDCRLPIWDPLLEAVNADGKLTVLDGLDQFREHLGGDLTIALPDSIGRKREVNFIDRDIMELGISRLKSLLTQK